MTAILAGDMPKVALTSTQRKAALKRRKITLVKIAKRSRRTPGHVRYVLRGERRDKRVELAVARLLGLDVGAVFPPNPNALRKAS